MYVRISTKGRARCAHATRGCMQAGRLLDTMITYRVRSNIIYTGYLLHGPDNRLFVCVTRTYIHLV